MKIEPTKTMALLLTAKVAFHIQREEALLLLQGHLAKVKRTQGELRVRAALRLSVSFPRKQGCTSLLREFSEPAVISIFTKCHLPGCSHSWT